jgi:hypothetical protein
MNRLLISFIFQLLTSGSRTTRRKRASHPRVHKRKHLEVRSLMLVPLPAGSEHSIAIFREQVRSGLAEAG